MANNSSHNKMYSECTYRIGGNGKNLILYKRLSIDCKYSLPHLGLQSNELRKIASEIFFS